MRSSFDYLQAETAGDETAELNPALADIMNFDTYSFLALVAVQAAGPWLYD